MANEKISQQPEDTTPADDDFLVSVDVSDTTDSPQGSNKKIQIQNLAAKKLKTTTGPTVLSIGAVADGELLKRSGTSIISEPAGSGGTTINSGNNYIPYRQNATTFDNSFISHDSVNGNSNFDGHITLNNSTNKEVAWGGSRVFGALTSGGQSIVKVKGTSTPGVFLSEWGTAPEPGGNPAPWSSTGQNFYRLLTGNITVGNPAHHGGDGTAQSGYEFRFMFQQDATGGRTVSYSSDFRFPGGVAHTMTATANAIDIVDFIVRNDIAYCINIRQDYS